MAFVEQNKDNLGIICHQSSDHDHWMITEQWIIDQSLSLDLKIEEEKNIEELGDYCMVGQ